MITFAAKLGAKADARTCMRAPKSTYRWAQQRKKVSTYWQKSVLNALCFGFLESGKFNIIQNIATQDAHGVYLRTRFARAYIHSSVGFRVACSD